MTRTEAASTIALHVRVAARAKGIDPSVSLTEEIVSEYRGGHRGSYLQEAARLANPLTIARLIRREA